jgi:hypothetical protein
MVIKNPNEEKLIHLLPFPLPTPVKNCNRVRVHIRGFNFDKNDCLEQVAQILGFQIVEEDKDADVVVLSKVKYSKLSKTLKSKFKGVFKQEKWLLKCLTRGKLGTDVEKLVKITPSKVDAEQVVGK